MLGRQMMPRRRLLALQEAKLRRLIRSAYRNVPYYRDLLTKSGLKPDDIRTLDDLSRIPISTKADLARLPPDTLIARETDRRGCLPITTSGSTGEPLTILWDDSALLTFYGTSARAHRILGGRLRDRILSIGPQYYPDNLLIQRLGIGRVRLVSPFKTAAELLRLHNDYRPDILLCYPSVLKCLSHACQSQRIKAHKPRLLLTSGEFLDDHTAERAESFFGKRPFQFYGSWEMGRIANQCQSGEGLHINEDICIAEFLPVDPGMAGDCHRLILTNLYNFTMPFIRYDQGDLVGILQDSCPCGQTFQRIKLLEARASEVIHLPDGSKVSALRFTGLIFGLPGVSQFKYVQERLDSLLVQIVETEDYSHTAVLKLVSKIQGFLPGVAIRVETVSRITPNPAGKIVQFESRVSGSN